MFNKGLKMLIGLAAIGLMIGMPTMIQATPGTKVLITDNPANKVIEVDPVTFNIDWEYGALTFPNEAIPLTNGDILIADTYGSPTGRVIQVDSATKQIKWQYVPEYSTTFRPVDIKRCVDFTGGTPTETLLITDGYPYNSKVMEITYPGKATVWKLSAIDIGGTGDYIFWEAVKRPGVGSPTCLITCRSNTGKDSVMEIEWPGDGTRRTITWQYGPGGPNPLLNDPRDAEWVPGGGENPPVLIADTDNQRIIVVDPGTATIGGTIVWEWTHTGMDGTFTPYEATMIENGKILVAGAMGDIDDNKDGIYPTAPTHVFEIGLNGSITWDYKPSDEQNPHNLVDVEEKGIINNAMIEYKDIQGNDVGGYPVLAGVVVPIFQPEIVYEGTPTIVATKTVSPEGPQRPGTELDYTISLQNTGNGTATLIMVTDQVPPGTEYVAGSTWGAGFAYSWSHDGGMTYDTSEAFPVTHIRFNRAYLSPGESAQLGFSVRIK
ncbi:MAG: hypothetical protein AB1414_06935 [bacterium]